MNGTPIGQSSPQSICAAQHERDGDDDAAQALWQRILSDDPTEESAHVGLMRHYARRGERQRAVRQYHQLHERLQRDLAIAPDSVTQRFYAAILSGQYPPTAAPQSAPPSVARPPHALPTRLTALIGREAEIAAVGALLDEPGRLLTLTGAGGCGKTRISGNNAVGVIKTNGRTVAISGVTIRDGKVTDSSGGAGILNNIGGDVTLTNSILTGNTATYDGGAIYNSYRTTLIVNSSTISGNTANRGGGIGTDITSTVTINSTISDNTANGAYGSLEVGGGSIYVRENANLTITNSTISNNAATRSGSGGGISSSATTVSLTGSIVSGNTATTFGGNGGGIYHTSSSSEANPLTITNSTISGNSAFGVGGIDASGPTSLRFTTVTNNTSTQPRDQLGTFGAVEWLARTLVICQPAHRLAKAIRTDKATRAPGPLSAWHSHPLRLPFFRRLRPRGGLGFTFARGLGRRFLRDDPAAHFLVHILAITTAVLDDLALI